MVLGKPDVSPEIAAERIHLIISGRVDMVVPLYSPSAQTRSTQPWQGRARKGGRGKHLRYESPSCSRVVLDVHPRVWERVADGSEAAEDHRVNEKVKKVDRLTGRHLSMSGPTGRKTDTGPQKSGSEYRSRRNAPRKPSGAVRILPTYRRTAIRSVSVSYPAWHAGGY